MRSIRLSLVVYFLVLQAATIGAAAWLVYYSARESLETERLIHQTLFDKQFEDDAEKERNRFDQDLSHKARALADMAQQQIQGRRSDVASLLSLGLLTSSVSPQGHMTSPVWVASGTRTPLRVQFPLPVAPEIVINEDQLPRDHTPSGEVYYQIDTEWNATWHSHNMGPEASYAVEPKLFEAGNDSLVFSDLVLPNGDRGRGVQIKIPVFADSVQSSERTARTLVNPALLAASRHRLSRRLGPTGPFHPASCDGLSCTACPKRVGEISTLKISMPSLRRSTFSYFETTRPLRTGC